MTQKGLSNLFFTINGFEHIKFMEHAYLSF